jgi:hypothetical protein
MPTEHPPGYAEIESASRLADQSDEWLPFITKVLNMEAWMVPAVQEVLVRQQRWRAVPNPIGYIRTAARREANRRGIHQDDHKHSEDRRCPCGAMTKAGAKERGHNCVYPCYEAGAIADVELPASAWRSESDSGSPRKQSYHAAHDQFVGDQTASLGIFTDDDDQEFIELDKETGVLYSGEPYMRGVPNHLRKRIEPVAKQFAEDDDFRLLSKNLAPGRTADGMLVVDWQKVASLLPIRRDAMSVVGNVIEMRFQRRLKFADVCNYPHRYTGPALNGEERRLRLQSAWKMIDRHMEDIKAILNPPPTRRAIPALAQAQSSHLTLGVQPGGRRSPVRPPLKNKPAR